MTTEPNNGAQHEALPFSEDGKDDLSHLPVEEQVAVLQDRLQQSQLEASQNLETAQRAQAEIVNFRRRTDEERITLGKYANERLINKLLPVVEELNLALSHAEKVSADNPWLEGVKLIQRKLDNVLQSEGVTEIEALGAEFNPMEHEALGTLETTEHPPGRVAEVVRAGYRLHERVIQPAQVMVATEPAKPQQT